MAVVESIYGNILSAFRNGEEHAFNYFFNAYYKPLYFFAFGYIKDKAVAEDIVSDSFIKVWDKREQFENEVGLKNYLYKTVYNGCMKEVRSQESEVRRKNGLSIVSDKFDRDCFENMVRAETIHLLYEAIEQLPTQCRTVFKKLYVEGRSVAETASEMNLTISTVKNQKARGLKILRPRFSQ
jgi:RNA polymerase sigma-70 factor (family 1)